MLTSFALIRLALDILGVQVVLYAVLLGAKGVGVWPIVAQLLLYTMHVLDLVGTCIRTWSDWFIVLDTEVDARDGVFAGDDTDLMCCFILEARRG